MRQNGPALMKLNHMADWTQEEYEAILSLHEPDSGYPIPEYKDQSDLPEVDQIDWRDKQAVTPVRDITSMVNSLGKQMYCAASYAVAAAETLEALFLEDKGLLNQFSVQQILDCSSDEKFMMSKNTQFNHNCEGGWMASAMSYMTLQNVFTEKAYPYKGVKQACNYKNVKSSPSYKSYKWRTISPGDPHALKTLLQDGPVAASISASSPIFRFYAKGVIDDVSMAGYEHM